MPRGQVKHQGFTSATSNLCDDYETAELEGGGKTTGSATACVTIELVPTESAPSGASSR